MGWREIDLALRASSPTTSTTCVRVPRARNTNAGRLFGGRLPRARSRDDGRQGRPKGARNLAATAARVPWTITDRAAADFSDVFFRQHAPATLLWHWRSSVCCRHIVNGGPAAARATRLQSDIQADATQLECERWRVGAGDAMGELRPASGAMAVALRGQCQQGQLVDVVWVLVLCHARLWRLCQCRPQPSLRSSRQAARAFLSAADKSTPVDLNWRTRALELGYDSVQIGAEHASYMRHESGRSETWPRSSSAPDDAPPSASADGARHWNCARALTRASGACATSSSQSWAVLQTPTLEKTGESSGRLRGRDTPSSWRASRAAHCPNPCNTRSEGVCSTCWRRRATPWTFT